MKTGIIERLKAAKSFEEAKAIAVEGRKFEWASPKTKRRWIRLLELKKKENP